MELTRRSFVGLLLAGLGTHRWRRLRTRQPLDIGERSPDDPTAVVLYHDGVPYRVAPGADGWFHAEALRRDVPMQIRL